MLFKFGDENEGIDDKGDSKNDDGMDVDPPSQGRSLEG